MHEISYRACFKPELPSFFISALTEVGDVVYDPFMGRGTTPLQAHLMGRRAIGNDVNPLSTLLVRPRTSPPRMEEVEEFLAGIPWGTGRIEREDLLVFYHPETLKDLEVLRSVFRNRDPSLVLDWVRMVALNRLTGHSSGFFSGRTMPPNQAVSVQSQRRINERLGITPPQRNISEIILKKTRSLLRHVMPEPRYPAVFFTGDAALTSGIPDQSVSLVVTSPPFLDIVQYADDNWLRCWFADIDVKSVPISMYRSPQAWEVMVRSVLIEMSRILRPSGHLAFEVGEVRKNSVLLEELVWSAAFNLPFERLGVLVNSQKFTKTSNIWGVENGQLGTNTNRIVLLRKAC